MDETEKYPSVGLAYEKIQSSYDVMVNRFEAANARIQNLMSWAIGVIGLIPVFAKVLLGDISFNALSLLPALLFFSALIIVGIIAYRTGGIKLIHPQILLEDYIKYPEWEYKKWMLHWAGKHFDINQKFINNKSRYIDIMTALLGLEVVSLVLWAVLA